MDLVKILEFSGGFEAGSGSGFVVGALDVATISKVHADAVGALQASEVV